MFIKASPFFVIIVEIFFLRLLLNIILITYPCSVLSIRTRSFLTINNTGQGFVWGHHSGFGHHSPGTNSPVTAIHLQVCKWQKNPKKNLEMHFLCGSTKVKSDFAPSSLILLLKHAHIWPLLLLICFGIELIDVLNVRFHLDFIYFTLELSLTHFKATCILLCLEMALIKCPLGRLGLITICFAFSNFHFPRIGPT